MWGLEATGALYGEAFQAEGARKQRRVGCCAHMCASTEESDRRAGRAGAGGAGGVGLGRRLGLRCSGQWQLLQGAKQGWPEVCWPCPSVPCPASRSHAPPVSSHSPDGGSPVPILQGRGLRPSWGELTGQSGTCRASPRLEPSSVTLGMALGATQGLGVLSCKMSSERAGRHLGPQGLSWASPGPTHSRFAINCL